MFPLDNRKCFTFTWRIENISYNYQRENKSIRSPSFVINVEQEYECYLWLYLKEDEIHLLFYRNSIQSSNLIDCELAFLSKDGIVIKSNKNNNTTSFADLFMRKNEIFVIYRSAYLAEDKLIVRCRIWKSGGELTENVQCLGRSRICIKREAFLWSIQNFSSLHSEEKCTYQIKSMPSNEVLISFDLLIKNPYTDEDSINIQPVSENGKIKYCVFYIMPLNGPGNANQSIKKEILFSDNKKPKLFTLPFSKNDLIARKDLCLPNDVLSLRCECTYTTGDIIDEIESVFYGCDGLSPIEADNKRVDEENTSTVSKRILNDDLKSLFHDDFLSDIKLKTSTKTFPAHKSILSARSPVFKAMFSNNMKEKLTNCVEIKDIDSETVFRMLLYIYTAEIQDLPCENACELYRAADIYQILALRDECSTYIKSNLSPINACEVLILADMHHDEDLKASVQEFIFNHDVLNSEEWKHLMKNHAKLAADTMYLQIQSLSKLPGSKSSTIEQIFGNRSAKINSVSSGFESTTTKTTSSSFAALNSKTVSSPFKPFLFSNFNEKESSAPRKVKIVGRCLRLNKKREDSQCSSHGFDSKETKFPAEFGMKSDRAPFAASRQSTIPKSEAAILELNSSNIKLPCSSKRFSFSTPLSFGDIGQKTPVQPSFSFGSGYKREFVTPSLSFEKSSEKESVKPGFLLGNGTEKEPVKSSFSFGSSDKREFVTPFLSFEKSSEKESVKPGFLLGNGTEKEPVKSSFSFGNSDKAPSRNDGGGS